MGHSDTVWPIGTLDRMPVSLDEGRLRGPGTLDMKGGLAMIICSLRALRDLDLVPQVAPVVFVNADEHQRKTPVPDTMRAKLEALREATAGGQTGMAT